MVNLNPTDSQLRSFASLLDARGSIGIGCATGKGYYYEQVRITGSKEELSKLQECFGGTVSPNGSRCGRLWRVTADTARHFFILVRPFMEARQDEVDVCIRFGKFRQESGPKAPNYESRALEARSELQKASRARDILPPALAPTPTTACAAA